MLVVAVHALDTVIGDAVVTGITFNGVALTNINGVSRGGGGVQVRTELWRLIAPSVGTFNVVITCTGTVDSLAGVAYELYNAMQQATEANSTNNLNGVAYISASVTTISGEALIIDAVTANTGVTFTPDTGQNERYDTNIGGAGARAGSTETPTIGSVNTQGQTASAATRLTYCVVALTGIHEINVSDNVSVAESAFDINTIYPFPLYSFVFDPFHVLVTEHTDIIDLVVEVGVVEESIYVVNQYAELSLDVLNIDINEIIALQETAVDFLDILSIDILDAISIVEGIYASLDVLIVNVLDPFHVLVTEHADVVDLMVEIGVVMEAIYVVNQYAVLSLDVLNIDVWNNITVIEDKEVYNDRNLLDVHCHVNIDEYIDVYTGIDFNVEDSLSISEDLSLFIDEFFLSIFDDVSISEFIDDYLDVLCLDILNSVVIVEDLSFLYIPINMEVYEDVLVSDSAEQGADPIPLDIGEDIYINEVAQITDLVIELGWVVDDISIVESLSIVLDRLLIDVSDLISIVEDLNSYVFYPFYYLSVYDWIITAELLDIMQLKYINVADLIGVSEFATVFDIIIELSAYESVHVAETSLTYFDRLFISIFDSISVVEYINMRDIIIELGIVYETIGVVEAVQVFLPYYTPRVSDSISIAESVSISILSMFINAFEVVFTSEHSDVIDLTIEVGIVGHLIRVDESIIAYLLNPLEVNDTIGVVEYIDILMPLNSISVNNIIAVSESIEVSVEPLINVGEYVYITEVGQITDLVIELGVVDDDIAVSEGVFVDLPSAEVYELIVVYDEAVLIIDAIYINVYDDVSQTEYLETIIPANPIEVYEDIIVSEYADILDLIIELFAYDGITAIDISVMPTGMQVGDEVGVSDGSLSDYITIEEFASILLPILFIDTVEDITVEEYALTHDVVVELFASEDINIGEWAFVFDAIIELGPAIESVTVIEWVDAEAFTAVVIHDTVSIVEFASLYFGAELSIYESIAVLEVFYDILIVKANIGYPRIFEVIPRYRIFDRYKTEYEEVLI
jgi:hypothetical protein